MPAHHQAAKEPMKAAATRNPSKVAVYAKAVIAFIAAASGAIGTWSAVALQDNHLSNNDWIGLGIALATPLIAALGVAAATNAKPADSEAGTTTTGVVLFVAVIILALALGFAANHLFLLLLILALLLLLV